MLEFVPINQENLKKLHLTKPIRNTFYTALSNSLETKIMKWSEKMLLKRIRYSSPVHSTGYPFHFNWLDSLKDFSFENSVTLLVGENGSGKSTLLEAIGIQADSILLSGETFDRNAEYSETTKLARRFKLEWSTKTRNGFYFRADDFISYIRETKRRKAEAEQALAEIEDPNSLARIPHARTLYELDQLYRKDLDTLSHGEAFLELFQSRLRPNALYFLDEPESPPNTAKPAHSSPTYFGCREGRHTIYH